jgi:hypothetical protein
LAWLKVATICWSLDHYREDCAGSRQGKHISANLDDPNLETLLAEEAMRKRSGSSQNAKAEPCECPA